MRNNVRNVMNKKVNETHLNTTIESSLHNRFDFEVVDAKTGKVKQNAYAENVICRNLWKKLFGQKNDGDYDAYGDIVYEHYREKGEDTDFFYGIALGNGDGVPSQTDTALFSEVFRINGYPGPSSRSIVPLNFEEGGKFGAACTKKYILDETMAVGEQLTEVGIVLYYDADNYFRYGICTHAMIKDMNGNKIAIKKTETDIINVYATIYVDFSKYAPPSIKEEWPGENSGIYITDVMGDMRKMFSGNGHDGLFHKKHIKFFINNNGTTNRNLASLNAIHFNSGNSVAVGIGLNNQSFKISTDADNKSVTLTIDRLKVENGNCPGGLHGLSCFSVHGYIASQNIALYSGGSWYPGSNVIGESIGTGDGTNVDFKTKFGMISNLKIYINGVETTDFSYDDNVPYDISNMGNEFRPMRGKESKINPLYLYSLNWDIGGCPIPYPEYLSSSTDTVPRTVYGYWYNPLHEKGITKVKLESPQFPKYQNYIDLYTEPEVACRNGCNEEWVVIPLDTTIPVEYQHYKYWRLLNGYFRFMNENLKSTNIHFNTPPAEGAVITADYFTKTIAKDSDHVFDASITLKFGEATPEE